MAVYPERRASKAAAWSRALAGFSLVLFLLAAVCHRYGLLSTIPFFWVLAVSGALTVLALVLAIIGFERFWTHGEHTGRAVTAAFIFGLLAASPFLVSAVQFFAYPRLYDISTDLENPPLMPEAARLRTAEMNAVAPLDPAAVSLQQQDYPDVTGRRYTAPSDRVYESIATLLKQRGWTLYSIASAPIEGGAVTIEAAAGSFLLNLPADVAIRLTDEETSSYVDMRSSSRYGLHDFGDNAARIKAFLTELDAVVAAQIAPPDADPDAEPQPASPQNLPEESEGNIPVPMDAPGEAPAEAPADIPADMPPD